MSSIKQTQVARFSFLSFFFLASLGSFYHGEDESDSEPLPISDTNTVAFTVMDEEARKVYREERRAELIESLALSTLSAEHQALIANAIAKIYVGIPVSSFTTTLRVESAKEDTVENTNTSHVSAAGHIQQENLDSKSRLDSTSPFVYFPPVLFVSETGKLLNESDSSITFEFEFQFPMDSENEDEMMAEFGDQMKWKTVITVNKASEAPERMTFKLAKTIRKRFVFKMTKLNMDFHYSYIDSCECFAVSRSNMEMKGSAIFEGRFDESFLRTFTDISCEQPVQFLLPEKTDSSFLSF